MGEISAIEWTDATFNPWMGCTKVSAACDNCYAETLMDHRYGKVQWGPHGERKRTSESNWQQPRRWQRQAAAFQAEHGRRRRVFCASLADVFDNKAPAGARDDLWSLIRDCPDLDWLLLTKRPQNVAKMLPAFWSEIRGRIWLGVSSENQDELERRTAAIDRLLKSRPSPAVVFASAEPLLGPLDFSKAAIRFDWIIVGGESGPGARPTNPEWYREIRDYCSTENVAFLFKQWGEWAALEKNEGEWPTDLEKFCRIGLDGTKRDDGWPMQKVGKKFAGRTLDGVLHTEFPRPLPPRSSAAVEVVS